MTGSVGGLSEGMDLARVDVDTDAFPDARCADGTNAIFFVRPASDPADADRWQLMLQGGGSCATAESCAARWCGMDGNFGGNKLSNRYAPTAGMQARGFHVDRPDNPFGTWNMVFLYYCSSDTWSGTRGSIEVEAPDPVSGGDPVRFQIEFHGSQIIDAVVDTLRAGVTTPLETMPSIDDAEEVVFMGASAGGNGTVLNLDRVANELRSTNPAVNVQGIIDSQHGVSLERLDFSATRLCTERGLCNFDELRRFLYDEVEGALWGARLDDTCEDWHRTMGTGNEHLCGDTVYLTQNHVTTPFVVRMGLRDSLISNNQIDLGYTVPERGGAPLDAMLWADLVGEQLLALTMLSTTANEGSDVSVEPGVFGPPCPRHETLRSTPDTYDASVRIGATDVTFPMIIERWRAGMPAAAVLRDPSSMTFSCP